MVARDNIKTWVFVTGVPRSGTTFVGKVLSLPLQVDYVHEPFNSGIGMPHAGARYQYVRGGDESELGRQYHEAVRRIQDYDIELKTSIDVRDPPHMKSIKRMVGSRGPFYLRLARANPFHTAAVIKDPTAGLVAEYLYTAFGIRPVIVVKHPVSLAASLKRLGWCPQLHWYRDQPHLMADYFSADEVERYIREDPNDIAVACAIQWRIVYTVLLAQARRFPDWRVVVLEEVSADPRPAFEALYHDLGLPWSGRVARRIDKMTSAGSVRARGGRMQDLNRDSAGIFEANRQALTLQERRRVFDVVGDVAGAVYTRDSFGID